MDLGVEGVALVAAIRRVEEATYAKQIADEQAAETKKAERRAKDAERKRTARASADIQRTNAESANVQRTPQPSNGHGADKDAPAHVRDNLPRLVTTGNSSAAAERADDWPNVKPGEIAKQLATLAGPGLADPAKAAGLTTTAGEIIRWRQMGCSWEQDVVPVVTGRTARPRANPIGSWTLLTNDVLAAKARRERPIETPEATGPPGGSITDRIAADSAASTRRALELLKANG